jgi:hypothetical protein
MKAWKIILVGIAAAAFAPSLYAQDSHYAAAADGDSVPPAAAEIDASKAGLKVYPNPVESEVRVVSEKYSIDRLAIYSNASGELVFLCSIPVPQGASIIINMNARASGYYVVRAWFKEVKKPVSCSIYKT